MTSSRAPSASFGRPSAARYQGLRLPWLRAYAPASRRGQAEQAPVIASSAVLGSGTTVPVPKVPSAKTLAKADVEPFPLLRSQDAETGFPRLPSALIPR